MAGEIFCPKCQDDLMSQDTQILSSQVTLEYEVVGKLEIDCEKCGEDVGQYIADRINAYSRLKQKILLPTDIFHDLRHFVSSIEGVLDSIKPRRVGVRRVRAVGLYFGTADGLSRSYEKVGGELGVSRTRSWDIINKALRWLRHPSQAVLIHRTMWRPPESFNTVLERAETAEAKLRELQIKGGDQPTEA